MRPSLFIHVALLSAAVSEGVLFPFEETQLTPEDTGSFSAIDFAADPSTELARLESPNCRAFPGTEDWPPQREWDLLGNALNGNLLNPLPPAAVCYDGENYNRTACSALSSVTSSSRFYINDPVTVLAQFYQGGTCPITNTPTRGNCTQGGFPVYVVNVTTVRDIQIAVNYARNRNIRLSIKNTGHDFLGRNLGAGSISIWTHWLKEFRLIENYTVGNYSGPAAHVGSGLEAFDIHNEMVNHNLSLVAPFTATVGGYGGFLLGGGHSTVTSLYGMGSDQVLALNVVTADGRFVTADPEKNSDLFFALRGGGGSTFGVVTSAVVKARPSIPVTIASFSFDSSDIRSDRNYRNWWQVINAYFAFAVPIVEAGGMDRNYVRSGGRSGYSFQTSIEVPNKSTAEVNSLLQPLISQFRALGLTVRPTVRTGPQATRRDPPGATPGNSRFSSRLFPAANWADERLFNDTMTAIRRTVEEGYEFHGLFMTPSKEVAGWPGIDSGLNPVWRTTIMHADLFDRSTASGTAALTAAFQRLQEVTDLLRAVTPGSGAYLNEAATREPDWQSSFFGTNYPRLLRIKTERDPWNVFWAPETVGSEGWQVITADGLPTQNGRLCRVEETTEI